MTVTAVGTTTRVAIGERCGVASDGAMRVSGVFGVATSSIALSRASVHP
jgi:hypothetical protein